MIALAPLLQLHVMYPPQMLGARYAKHFLTARHPGYFQEK